MYTVLYLYLCFYLATNLASPLDSGVSSGAPALVATGDVLDDRRALASSFPCFTTSFVSAIAPDTDLAALEAMLFIQPHDLLTVGFARALFAKSVAAFAVTLAARVVRPDTSYFSSIPFTDGAETGSAVEERLGERGVVPRC